MLSTHLDTNPATAFRANAMGTFHVLESPKLFDVPQVLFPALLGLTAWTSLKKFQMVDKSGVILGRSDSTINRQGVRMGSSEIYNTVEDMTEVLESLVVGFNLSGGEYFIPLFVVLKGDIKLDDTLKDKIKKKIRSDLSPRHLPDEIYSVPEIPRTLNAKKLEVPVKKILSGIPLEKALNVDSMSNPESIKCFLKLKQQINRLKTI